MGIEFDLKRTYVVDGKEYVSLDDMPPDLRRAVGKSLSSASIVLRPHGRKVVEAKIVFNGPEVAGPEALPGVARRATEAVPKTTPEDRRAAKPGGEASTAVSPRPIDPGPGLSSSSRRFLAAAAILGLGLAAWLLL